VKNVFCFVPCVFFSLVTEVRLCLMNVHPGIGQQFMALQCVCFATAIHRLAFANARWSPPPPPQPAPPHHPAPSPGPGPVDSLPPGLLLSLIPIVCPFRANRGFFFTDDYGHSKRYRDAYDQPTGPPCGPGENRWWFFVLADFPITDNIWKLNDYFPAPVTFFQSWQSGARNHSTRMLVLRSAQDFD